nr:tetratricopeptide repeat protein [uncultured bacterium]
MTLAEQVGLENNRKRAQLLREAVHFDPGFLLAWGDLADELDSLALYSQSGAAELGGSQAPLLHEEAVRARARVLALAPKSWMALRIRSEQLANEKRWAESIEVARQILETGPFTLERAYPYISVIFVVGRIDETIELVERVIRLEPLAIYPSRDQQWNLFAGRRYRETDAEYRRSRDFEGSHLQPDFIALLRALGQAPSSRPALRAAYDQFQSNYPENERSGFITGLGPLLDARAALRALVRKVIEERRPGFEDAYPVADAVGEPDLALASVHAFLEAPFNQGFRKYWNVWLMPYSSVRTLPGFKALLREMGVVDYWRQTGKWGDFCRPVGADDFECR